MPLRPASKVWVRVAGVAEIYGGFNICGPSLRASSRAEPGSRILNSSRCDASPEEAAQSLIGDVREARSMVTSSRIQQLQTVKLITFHQLGTERMTATGYLCVPPEALPAPRPAGGRMIQPKQEAGAF